VKSSEAMILVVIDPMFAIVQRSLKNSGFSAQLNKIAFITVRITANN